MSKPIRLLLVEDSEDDQELVLRNLRRGGYEVEFQRVDTAAAMNEALARGQWDIILSDFSMPHFSAVSALELLQSSGLDLPFVIVSGSVGEETAVAMMKAGVHDYVMKENLARLTPVIERELREAEIRRERRVAQEERDRLLASEQKARQEAETASRLKDEFLATMSHELRTPLTAIIGWAHLLRSRNLDSAVADKALATIERNARTQAQLVEDLLDVSGIITGNLRLDVHPTDLIPVIQAAIETMRPAADAKSIVVEMICGSLPVQVSVDSNRMQQILWNLLSNAIKFTPQNGRVEVSLRSLPEYVEIEVSDTGAGISPEFLPFVFDRFRQADMSSTRAHGGLGLGLGIARHLVELHGGTIQAASKGLGRGATFTIRLPLATTQSQSSLVQNTDAAKVTNQNRDATRVLKGLRVLVVDDEIDIREMLTLMLRNNGAEVIAVASGREALDELKRAQPDVLMCDIGMPEMDGYSLIGKVRSLPFGDTIPAIALTAYAKEEDRSRALASGFQVHAPKPVDPEKLISLIASLAFNN